MSERPSASEVLARHFPRIPGFRPGQEPAVARVVSGRNTICLMPTGAGKSLVYQVAGIQRGATTLVISPLVALMGQQVDRLREENDIEATSLSDLSGPKLYDRLRSFDFARDANFLFTSPERLSFDGFLEFVLKRNKDHIGLIVVDEAHCISQWGHTFRPAYKAIPRFLDATFGTNGWPPVLCLTATLNPRDLAEISNDFRVEADDVVRGPTMMRTNLALACEHHADEPAKKIRLAELLTTHAGEKIIVYVHRKSGEYGTELLAKDFAAQGFSCDYFDADRKEDDKRSVLAAFESGSVKVVFATSAFGMGIDIPDIRVVIHYLLPESIEQYYQEVGRAGRDDLPARGYLLFSDTNTKVRRTLIKSSVVTRAEIQTLFDGKLAQPQGQIRGLDSWQGLSEERGELFAWFLLQQTGIVNVVAKGPAKIDCFAPARAATATEFLRYQANAGGAGLVLGIAKRLGVSVSTIIENLWTMYADHELSMVSSPSHKQFFAAPALLPTDKLDAVEADIQTKLEARLEGFETLVAIVQSAGDPSPAIRKQLGL